MKFSSYLEQKKISIEVRDWVPSDDGEYKPVIKRIEGDTPTEFFQNYENKFGAPIDQELKDNFLKIFTNAIGRAKQKNTKKAEVDAAIAPKSMSRDEVKKITKRN